jgi:L-ascorbate metabolism protein UlaG (beta-lactamase superfamily)
MLRLLSVLAVSLLVVSLGWSKDPLPPNKPTITWYGQSFFILKTSRGTTVAFDPHAIAEYGRIEGLRADIVLMSHKHPDHIQNGVFENAGEKGDKAPEYIRGWKPGDNGQETWNIFTKKKVKDIEISTVGVFHDDVSGMKRGINTVFIVEADGWRICHLGDLGHKLSPAQLKAIGEVDVLMIPCGGIYSLNGDEAKTVLAQIKPKEYVMAMHIGTDRYFDLLTIEEFVDGNPYRVAVSRDDKIRVKLNSDASDNYTWLKKESPQSDNTLILDRNDDRPRPVIVGLHYWPQASKLKKDKDKDKEKEKDKDK